MSIPNRVFTAIEDREDRGGGAGNPVGASPASPSVSPSDSDLLDAYSRAVIAVVRKIGPAVISMLGPRGEERGGVGSGFPTSRQLVLAVVRRNRLVEVPIEPRLGG